MPNAVDAAVTLIVLAAAWRGYRRGGLSGLAGLAGFALAWWWMAGHVADLATRVAGSGALTVLARVIEPYVAAWLPPEVAAAPVRSHTLLRALDGVRELSLPDGARAQLADGLRRFFLAGGAGAETVGELFALAAASLLLYEACLYALPLLAGALAAAAGRRLAGWMGARGLGPVDRALGAVAGAAEASLAVALALLLLQALAGLWPRPEPPGWLEATHRSAIAGWLARRAAALLPAVAGPALPPEVP